MNKIAKIISVVLSVSLVIGVSVAMLVSAFAADTPKFSLNVVEDGDEQVVLELSLDKGSFTAFDIQITAKDWNAETKTTGLVLDKVERVGAFKAYFVPSDEGADPVFAASKENGKISFAGLEAFGTAGSMIKFTFSKQSSDKIDPSDIIAIVNACTDGEKNAVTGVSITNNIPVPEKPVVSEPSSEDVSEPSSEDASEPSSEDASEPSSEDASEPSSEDASEPSSEDVSEPSSEDASEPSSEDASEPSSEDASEPSSEDASEPSSEDASEPSSEDASEPSSEDASEPSSEDASEPSSEDASEPSSEDVSEPSSEATEPSSEDASSDEKSTVAPVVDSTVNGSASSDVVNPKTGDRLTATAAVISLLAISGAAVVALRKKED